MAGPAAGGARSRFWACGSSRHGGCQVLAASHERAQEPRRQRHPDRRSRWVEGLPRGDHQNVPRHGRADLHPRIKSEDASDPSLACSSCPGRTASRSCQRSGQSTGPTPRRERQPRAWRRALPFFVRSSFKAALSSIDCASSFFTFRFSSSRPFSRFASDTSSPPYLPSSCKAWAPKPRACGPDLPSLHPPPAPAKPR